MNGARYHYPEEFQRHRLNAATVLLLVAAGLVLVAVGSFVCGMEWSDLRHREAARIEAAKPKRAQPATFAPLLKCDKHDLIEYARVCRARDRMTKVGP